MYCPRCSVEYREGFRECSDCRVLLKAGPPPDPGISSRTEPEFPPVTVFDTNDGFALTLAKSALQDAGIEYAVLGGDTEGTRGVFGLGTPGLFGAFHAVIQVRPEDKEAARALVEQFEQPE